MARFHSLEVKVTQLQQEVIEKCAPPQLDYSVLPPPMDFHAFTPTASLQHLPSESASEGLTSYLPEAETSRILSPLQDITSRSNVVDTVGGDFNVPSEDVTAALQACRSRRNLAARLAGKIFSPWERSGSNCRGVLGKTALDGQKVKAIYSVCMQHFPLQRLETKTAADKEMRNAIDEVCQRTKIPATENA